MRIILLPAIAGLAFASLALAALSQVAVAADNGQPPRAGTPQSNQNNAPPMDRHDVIRPPEHTTQDPNQAEVPGTRDNPTIMDRDRRFDHGPNPPPPPKIIDRDTSPLTR